MTKATLSRFGLLHKEKQSTEEEAPTAAIPAWKPEPGGQHRQPADQPGSRPRRVSRAAFLALLLALALLIPAGRGLQEWQRGMLRRQHEDALQPKLVPDSGLVGAHFRSTVEAGPDLHHSSVWDAACEGTQKGEPPHRLVLQAAQTRRLVVEGTYRRRVPEHEHGSYERCRSDAQPDQPLPRLRRVALLRSKRPRPEGGVTIMTQLSLERMAMLERQCRAWPHPTAAAVYIPLLYGRVASADDRKLNGSTLDAALVPLLQMHAAAENGTGCILDLEIVSEVHCNAKSASLYPANAVRNRALRLVETEAVILLDADFVPSTSLAVRMADKKYRSVALALLQQPLALVLPAFQTSGNTPQDGELGVLVAKRGKALLLEQYEKGTMSPFHSGQYSKGHRATDFDRWASAANVYTIEFEPGFEPYVLVHRKHVPWYDERCRGYFVNKLLHRAHMASLGIKWVVHPGGFVVHLPHKVARMKSITRDSGLKEFNNQLFATAQVQMRAGSYMPFVSDPHLCYSSRLWDDEQLADWPI